MSGPNTRAIAARIAPRASLSPHFAQYCEILDEIGAALDRGVVLFAPAPQSYTGEDTLELQVHGSPIVVRDVLRALLACGARLAQPGEFTQRAFLLGKMNLQAAAAVADLIDAQTRSAARAALANLAGGIAHNIQRIRASLARVLEELAGSIDFPDEVPEPQGVKLDAALVVMIDALDALKRDGETGRLVREGITVAIVGPPNVGKSSLLNALLGEERALVSEIAGTTRDTIEDALVIDGVLVRIVDTAGIREHADRLESAGIERSRQTLASARVVLLVVDASQPLDASARALLDTTQTRERVVLCNKADLGRIGADAVDDSQRIVGSVRDHATLDEVRRAIARVGWRGERPDVERPHIASLREYAAVNEALDSLTSARAILARGDASDFIVRDLQAAHAVLGHLSGDLANEEVVAGVFARFCIGK